jgi:magnesium chelatase family protein
LGEPLVEDLFPPQLSQGPDRARIESFALSGIEALRVEVQVALDDGYPMMTIVGLPDAAVRESRERVLTAFRASGIKIAARKTTVNLAPAEVRKEGSAFDLPIALCILAAHGIVPAAALTGLIAAGELTLSGEVRPVRGALAMALAAARHGTRCLLLPHRNLPEVGNIPDARVIGCSSLAQAGALLSGEEPYVPGGSLELLKSQCEPGADSSVGIASELESNPAPGVPARPLDIDLAQISGQAAARRALEVAAAGGHNLLLVGPPGTGKTLLARAFPAILPEMEEQEALETTLVYSVAGQLRGGVDRIRRRPFRAPHHTVSAAGLIGGGAIPQPGEVSLAHCGVLFLDELPEFKTNVLNLLRQPLEEGCVRLVRAGRTVRFPCRFALAAAMNPCPCGFLGHPVKPCRCTPHQVRAYQGRINGPLLDRMDLHVEVPALSSFDVVNSTAARAESSAVVRARVEAARAIQRERFAVPPEHAGIASGIGSIRKEGDVGPGSSGSFQISSIGPAVFCNSQMSVEQIDRYCELRPGTRAFLERAVESLSLSARGVHRSLRVARTIADLSGGGPIEREHVAEAIQYRWLDRRHEIA